MKRYEDLKEATKKDYEVYHSTYTSAVNEALEYLIMNGYTYNEEDSFKIIGTGTKKPRDGETTSFSLPIYKEEKLLRKALQVQVYNRGIKGNTYELNCYIL